MIDPPCALPGESIFLGDSDLSQFQVNHILAKMGPEWMGPTYDTLRRNCCNFSRELAIELGVGSIPKWVYSLAKAGAKVDDKLRGMEESKQQHLLEREKGKAAELNSKLSSTLSAKELLMTEVAVSDDLAERRDDQDDQDGNSFDDTDDLTMMGSSLFDDIVASRVRTDLSRLRLEA